MLDFWRAIDAFKTQQKLSEGRPEFSFFDGPPFATGLPHYGHLLAGTIKVGEGDSHLLTFRTLSPAMLRRPDTTSSAASDGTRTAFLSSTRLIKSSASRARRTFWPWVSTSTTPSAAPL